MPKRRLIDAGMSSSGWSRIGTYMKCPQLFAYQRRLGLKLISADALTRGSMGHVIQAHQHAIWGAKQGGVWVDKDWIEDPNVFLPPEEAIAAYCDQHGGHDHLDRMLETFRRYMAQYPEPPGRVVAVEYPVSAMLGYVDRKWGLWVEKEGRHIDPTPLDCPGHLNHGKPFRLTRRLDRAVGARTGRGAIWDHKHQARVQPNRSVDAYAIDGGFGAFRLMGRQLYKDFGGVMVNLIQTTENWKVARRAVPPTPHRDNHLAQLIWRAEHDLARLDKDDIDHWEWPKAMHETACYGRYGKCAGLHLCSFGRAALDR